MKLLGLFTVLLVIAAALAQGRPPMAWRGPGRGGMPIPIHQGGGRPGGGGPGPHQFAHRRIQNHGPPPKFRGRPPMNRRPPPPGYMRPPMYGGPQYPNNMKPQHLPQHQGTKMSPPGQVVLPPLHPNSDGVAINVPPAPSTSSPLPSPPQNFQNQNNQQQQQQQQQNVNQNGQRQQQAPAKKDAEVSGSNPIPMVVKPDNPPQQQQQPIIQLHLGQGQGPNGQSSVIQIHYSSTPSPVSVKEYYSGSTLRPQTTERPTQPGYPDVGYRPQEKPQTTTVPPVFRYKPGENNGQTPVIIGRPNPGQGQGQGQGQMQNQNINQGNMQQTPSDMHPNYPQNPNQKSHYGEVQGRKPNQDHGQGPSGYGQQQEQGQNIGFRPPQVQGQFQDPVKDMKYGPNPGQFQDPLKDMKYGPNFGQHQNQEHIPGFSNHHHHEQRPQHAPNQGYGPSQIPHPPQQPQNSDNSGKRVYERPIIYKQSEEVIPGKTAYTSAEFGQAPKSHYNKNHHYKSEYPDILTAPNPKPFDSSEEIRRESDFYSPSKYSQPDPLYHPHGDVIEAEELSVPSRYDNSFATTYKNDKPPRPPQNKPNPEDILTALGLSTNPLDHPDIQKTASEKLRDVYKQDQHQNINYEPLDLVEYLRKKAELEEQEEPRKEPLYSTPDRPVYDEDISEEAYPGTGYKMDNAASKVYLSKRPAPEPFPPVRGLHPPAPSHNPNHDFHSKEDSEEYRAPSSHRHRPRDPPHHHSRDPIPHHPRDPPPRDLPPPPHDPRDHPTGPDHGYGAPTHRHDHYATPPPYPIYVTEPEPIIEIIVQDSNVTLPPRPTPRPTLPPPTTPEPVHVFYVRYSSNNKSNNGVVLGDYGGGPHFAESGQSLNLERPVPSIALRNPGDPHAQPSSHAPVHNAPHNNHYNGPAQTQQHQHLQQQQLQPTTMRALIRPNTNEYESAHLKVAFDRNAQPFQNYVPPAPQNHGYDQQPQGSVNVGNVVQQHLAPHEPQHNTAPEQPGHALAPHQQYNPVPQQQHNVQPQPTVPSSISFQQLHLHPELPQQPQNPPQHNQQHHQQPPQPHQHAPHQNNQHQHQQQNGPAPMPQFAPQPHYQQQQQPQLHHNPQQHNVHQHQASPPQHQAPPQQQQPAPVSHFAPQPQHQAPQQHQVPQQQQHHQQQPVVQQQQQYAQPQQQQQQYAQPPQQQQPQVQTPEPDLSMDPIWTNWSNQQNDQQPAGSNSQPSIQVSTSFNFAQPAAPVQQQPQSLPPVLMPQPQPQPQQQQPQQAPATHNSQPHQPMQSNMHYNNGGGQPLGLAGYQAIGTENSMSRESTVGLRPPPGPIYPGFQKRMGLDDLASLLAEESGGAVEQQRFQEDPQQHIVTYHQESGGIDVNVNAGYSAAGVADFQNAIQQYQEPQTAQSQNYQDQTQQDQQQEQYQAQPSQQSPILQYQQPPAPQQPLQFQTQQNQQFLSQQQPMQYQTQSPVQSNDFKLPDDVPEDLKQQLLSSGILGNAEVQVVNFDQNLFKELGDLPPEALAALNQQSDSSSPAWNGSPVTLPSDGDLSALLGQSRPVRSVLIVDKLKKDRPKRGGNRDQYVIFLTDNEAVLYNRRTKKLFGVKREESVVQRAIEYSHHKLE